MRESVFTLESVSFRFPDDSEKTLDNISFSIFRGERVVISGPSGCGKSTLLYLLNRLYPVNCDGMVSGNIFIFSKPAELYAPGEINHRIATVFQDPDSQFCMPTVEEELAFTLENLHVPFAGMETRMVEILELTGLADLRHANIQSLSGGMKQRVATACALIMKPEVLLLDEPISHLDPFTAKEFISWLDELQRQFDLTIVVVEHRLDAWETFFQREISMDGNGEIIADQDFSARRPILFPERVSAMSGETAISVTDLSVKLKEKMLLNSFSFKAKRGEIVAIAGPNGSGKSTLAKALCGIHKKSSGRIQSDGIGYVPQSPEYLFLTQSVKDELAFSGLASREELTELMERLGMDGIKEAHPFSVSHGQKRRVAIGAMLADKRPVLLMDEPTSGQDEAALYELFDLIDGRARDGSTVFIITHDMEFAASIADSVLLIKDGQLTGKFAARDVWQNEQLLAEHHLLPPKGVAKLAESFA
ncbi:ATP-binding cassette domain-containing protein [Planococcus salinus]|uniref:ATP-binding cassette domain-containing protein n=1 Tax=Planococcus salinus TaxID=1848460 RepID=A0A3M8P9Q2_9BACL|nr:ATP-binding cassette domain-containing protein [Planococcus salinus]